MGRPACRPTQPGAKPAVHGDGAAWCGQADSLATSCRWPERPGQGPAYSSAGLAAGRAPPRIGRGRRSAADHTEASALLGWRAGGDVHRNGEPTVTVPSNTGRAHVGSSGSTPSHGGTRRRRLFCRRVALAAGVLVPGGAPAASAGRACRRQLGRAPASSDPAALGWGPCVIEISREEAGADEVRAARAGDRDLDAPAGPLVGTVSSVASDPRSEGRAAPSTKWRLRSDLP